MSKQAKSYEISRAIKNATHVGQVRRWSSSERYWHMQSAFEALVGQAIPVGKPALKTAK